MINRLDERAFYATLEASRSRTFDWSTWNCGHFARDVGRCWGIEIEVPVFPEVQDAVEWLRARDARSYYEFLRKRMGNPVAPLQGNRGWIAYQSGQGLDGSCIGTIDRGALFVGDRGLIETPLADITCAFNPGRYRG